MSSDTSSSEIFEAFQKMINPMAFPMQNLLLGAMKPEEIQKKISELETVRHWLSTNIGLLDLSIKTLEYQRQLLTSVKGGMSDAPPVENPFLNPKLWPWPYQQPDAGAPSESAKSSEPPPVKPAGRKTGRPPE